MKRSVFLSQIIIAILAVAACAPKNEDQVSRMDRSRLNVGTYFLHPYACTEDNVKALADCGIDFVVCMQDDKTTLDLFSKYGVGAVVTGVLPGWWGGDGDNAGQLETVNPIEKYEEAAASFTDHPAIWGIDIGDEPSALDFPYYGKVFTRVGELFPQQFPYLNLYPNYASVSQNDAEETVNQLGTPTYAEHIRKYCENVPSDYICYDFYVYSCDVLHAYDNLHIVADACNDTGRSMWIVLQVNSREADVWTSENRLRFQAYTAMAFGAENIIWACWTAGWWNNQVLDDKGEKTEQYGKLQKVNSEIRCMAGSYMKYRRTSTAFVGFEGTGWLDGSGQESVDAFDNGIFEDVRMEDGSPLVAGSMESRDGSRASAIFVCSADDPYDEAPAVHTLRFKTSRKKISACRCDGPVELTKDSEGYWTLTLASNQAAIIEVSAK